MKKTYEKPELIVENFDVEDIITASGLTTVQSGNSGYEADVPFPW